MDDREARRREIRDTYGRAREVTETLEARAEEILEITKRIEKLTDGTPEWYPRMRARVEAEATVWQVRVLVRTLEKSPG